MGGQAGTDDPDEDWKLKLRYGKLRTPYMHYTAIAEGVDSESMEGISCSPGIAFMGMKTWASSADEAAHMKRVIGEQIGFTVTGRIHVYDTEPTEPPRVNPYGYDIKFTSLNSHDTT